MSDVTGLPVSGRWALGASQQETVLREDEVKSDAIQQAWREQRFAINQRLRYHRARVRFFGQVERAALGGLLVFLAVSVAYFLGYGLGPWSCGGVTAVSVLAFGLAHGLGRWSRRHTALLDRLAQLDMWAASQGINRHTLAHLMEEYQKSLADAPPVLVVLDALSHNALRAEAGDAPEGAFVLTPWQRRLASVCDLNSQDLKAQIRQRAHQAVGHGIASEQELELTVLSGLTCHRQEPQTETLDEPGKVS